MSNDAGPERAKRCQVLVVGAGPTGLTLALWLIRCGVTVRVIDKAAQTGTTSRALAVHARTLELYRGLDLAEEVVEQGLRFAAVNMWVGGHHVSRADFSDIGTGLSPFPFVVIFPQDQHEALLERRLATAGVVVERHTELVGLEQQSERVIATVVRAGGTREAIDAAYLAGCDGAHSAVREALRIGFPGGTYSGLFYVADVALHGKAANGELHVALDRADFLALFPLKGGNTGRLIGTVRRDARTDRALTWNDVQSDVLDKMQIEVDDVRWFSTYRVHHRVAERFRQGRTFLLGDAGHVHSPVGGQGMNTGIGDAANLAWKLAAVVGGRASESILDSYEPERIAFAKRLVATTDRVFSMATRDGAMARRVRVSGIPKLLPPLMRLGAIRRFMFRTVSQTLVRYRQSPLSEGRAGAIHGGDRLPWIRTDAGDNFDALMRLDWHVHVYGTPDEALVAACQRQGIDLTAFPWCDAARRAGLGRDAAYLVRPDGYVALAAQSDSGGLLEAYLAARRIVVSR